MPRIVEERSVCVCDGLTYTRFTNISFNWYKCEHEFSIFASIYPFLLCGGATRSAHTQYLSLFFRITCILFLFLCFQCGGMWMWMFGWTFPLMLSRYFSSIVCVLCVLFFFLFQFISFHSTRHPHNCERVRKKQQQRQQRVVDLWMCVLVPSSV